MDPSHLNELVVLEDSYWWHVAKRELALGLLQRHFPPPGKLVEGGIGSARNLLAFQERGYDVTGLDLMPQAIQLAKQRHARDVRLHDLMDPWPLPAGSVSAVVLLDVLEHVSDPVAVLGHARRVLRKGGGIVVTVPAYPWLFGDWDVALGHYRRYTAPRLQQQAGEAGLSVRRLGYWNSFTLPAAIAVRIYQRLLPKGRGADFPRVSPETNWLLLWLARCERLAMRWVTIPCGLSVVGVLEKA
jgi:SAM-dependent methyltransferase